MILVLIIVVFGCAFLGLQIYNLKKQNTELKARKERLTELLSEETLRSEAFICHHLPLRENRIPSPPPVKAKVP